MPVPGQGELLVRVEACGVCHTDLHTVEGDLGSDRLPLIPGHEVIGTVESLGSDCTRLCVGDRVGMAWLHHTCQCCRFCTTERENLCETAVFTGYDANGGYAEFTTVPEAFAYRIPEGLDPVAAAPLLCAGIIGYRALRVSGIQPGGRLGLVGFGASAHIAIQIARYWGCEVYVFTRSADHKVHALELGAVWAGEAADPPPKPLDAVVNFPPAGSTVPYGLQALDRGGTLALAVLRTQPAQRDRQHPPRWRGTARPGRRDPHTDHHDGLSPRGGERRPPGAQAPRGARSRRPRAVDECRTPDTERLGGFDDERRRRGRRVPFLEHWSSPR
jgi:propanol-preferring alcohol dehydrogenase